MIKHFNLVFAQQLPFGNLPPDINCGSDFFACLAFFFNIFLDLIVTLAFVLAVIFIAWGGIEYIVYGGNENKRKTATNRLIWGTIGLIVALMAFVFVVFLEIWIRENRIQENRMEEGRRREEERRIELIRIDFSPLIAYAQIREKPLPEKISCGPVSLPSVLTSTPTLTDNIWKICLLYYLQRFISFLYGLALAMGVLFLVWAGVLYITQPEKTKDIHPKLFYGILGIIIAILSFTIVKIINLFFTNLS